MRRLLLGLLIALTIVSISPSTNAAVSGNIQGILKYYNELGNYCPYGRDCTGAKYQQSSYETFLPVKSALVVLRNRSTNGVIGSGSSSSAGSFAIGYYDPTWFGPMNIVIEWHTQHAGSRFKVTDPSTTAPYILWAETPAVVGSRNVGVLAWGSEGASNEVAQIYAGAEMAWSNSLSQSARLVGVYPNVRIKFPDSTACLSACASGQLAEIQLSTGRGFSPQSRIMHEMGHIASYRASRDESFLVPADLNPVYSYGSDSGWSSNEPEWGWTHFEEAAATHFANVALYYPNATTPHYCQSDSFCPSGQFNLENSGGSSCGTDVHRWPVNGMRYLWDMYDSLSDGYGDNVSQGIWTLPDTIYQFGNGTNNNQKDELWNSANPPFVPAYLFEDDYDGRSFLDFYWWALASGINTGVQLVNNCGSPGD